jgi:hypothetical protein
LGIAHHFEQSGLVLRAAYGIFYTPVDMNTWCNELHNVPVLFPITQQSNNFTPQINGFNFPQPVLGQTTVSFSAFDPHAPAQYVQQWSTSLQKTSGAQHYAGGRLSRRARLPSAARGPHQQRAPAPGALQARRPYQDRHLRARHRVAVQHHGREHHFPVSSVNLLQNTARSWYDAGYVNLRRRYAHS